MPNEIGVPNFKTQDENEKKVHEKLQDLPPKIYELLYPVFLKNESLMSSSWDVPVCRQQLHFEFKSELPKQTKIYPIPEAYKSSLFATLQYMVFFNIIERAPVNLNYGSPLFCIPRKTLPGGGSRPLRILIDMRVVNSYISGSTSASMESCWQILREVSSDAVYFSSLDLTNMFYSIKVSQEVLDQGYQNFLTPYGAFRMLRIASGCSLAPSFASGLLLEKLYLDSENNWSYIPFVRSFYDDLTITSKSGETMYDHAEKVSMVLSRINQIGFAVSTEKSILCKNLHKEHVEVLGFQISHNKIEITEKRRANVVECIKTPTNVKQLQRIMGQINYLRHLLQPIHLNCLAKLPTKMKGKKLIWDNDGEQCLETIKEGLRDSAMAISIPPENSIVVIFSDSSEIAIAGILFFVPLSVFDIEEDQIKEKFALDPDIDNHLQHYDINCTGISEIHTDILQFAYVIYYTYVHSINPSFIHVLNKIANQFILSFPEFLPLTVKNASEESATVLKQIIIDLQKRDITYQYIDNFIILALTKILGRQLLMINTIDDQPMKTPFVKIGFPTSLSPILISYSNKKYQLLALEKEYDGQKRFSKIALHNLSNQEILKLFQINYKKGKYHYGGSFSKKISESHAHSPIFIKELLALTASLSYFEEYIKVSQTLAIVDSSTISHSLKAFKSKENIKMFRIGLSLSANYPRLQFVLCPTAQNKADIYTRFCDDDVNKTHILPSEIELCDIKNYIKKLVAEEGVDSIEDISNAPISTSGTRSDINLVSPISFDYSIGKLATVDKIREANLLLHQDKIKDTTNYEVKDGIIFKNKQIVLPPSLYPVYILKEHVSAGHMGQTRMIDHLRYVYCIENLKKLKEDVISLLNACLLCASSKSTFNKNFIWHSNYGYSILKSISIDCIEFTKVTQKTGHFPIKAILLIICNVSKYVSIQFLQNMTIPSIINAFLSYLSGHPTPQVVTSDNASNFRNDAMTNLFRTFGIRHVTSSPQVSRARGIVERKIKEYREYARRFSQIYPRLRVELAYVFATKVLNNTKLHNIPASPNFLASFEPNSFIYRNDFKNNVINEFTDRLVIHDKKDRVKDQINCEKAYNDAIEILKDIKEKRLKSINKNRHKHDFTVNDIVVVRNYARTVKHAALYIFEPHLIVKVLGSLVITQSLITGIVRNRHISHIKRINKLKNLEIPEEIIAKNNLYSEALLQKIIEDAKIPEERTKMRLRRKELKGLEEERLDEEELDNLLELGDEVHFELD